jgi:hypothetical protein
MSEAIPHRQGARETDMDAGSGSQEWTEDDVKELESIFRLKMRTKSLDDVCIVIRRMKVNPSLVDEVVSRLRKSAEQIRVLRDPPTIEAQGRDSWYVGPGEEDTFWPAIREHIAAKWKNRDAVKVLDRSSTRVVAALGDPRLPRTTVRGLVAGDVQSGKTSNFTAVIAKAADSGFRMVIVLSGTKNKLRRQTQERIEEDLVARNQNGWFVLTTPTGDFAQAALQNAGQVLVRSGEQPVLMVVKKNSRVLAKVCRWLDGAGQAMRLATPTLVIDDEADEASINTRPAEEERSAVNSRILQILSLLPKVSFVGYTATPYANFFIDASAPEDLYPRDFIINLSSGNEYFGYERIFGRERTRYEESEEKIDGLNMIRRVPKEEIEVLRSLQRSPPNPVDLSVLGSLTKSLAWFLLATAARIRRGHVNEHSSMLIHTSQRVAVHRMFEEPLEDWLETLASSVHDSVEEVAHKLRDLWDAEISCVPAVGFDRIPDDFNSVWEVLPEVLKRVKVVVENGMTVEDERLIYGRSPGIFIVIGGDVLSRGLTLEGLVCSFFTRSASTYDTLMQMGRWFGYRRGYDDLPRIWMTDELKSAFFELGGIDRELRQQIERTYVNDVTPATFAPLIRTHPGLAITSRMKMQADVQPRRLSYSMRRVQTILFNHRNDVWLDDNLTAADSLIRQAAELGIRSEQGVLSSHILYRKVDVALVLQFLKAYNFHAESWNLNPAQIRNYIEIENRAEGLLSWSVAVVTGSDTSTELVTLGRHQVQSISRSRIAAPDLAYANIKSLMSQDDCAADLQEQREESFADLLERRTDLLPGTGLIVLYPIDRHSSPRHANDPLSQREPLDAVGAVIGVGLVFPRACGKHQDGVYLQQRVTSADVELPDEEQINAE